MPSRLQIMFSGPNVCRMAARLVLIMICLTARGGAVDIVESKTALPPSQTAPDVVNGNLIQFNDNGAWTWYSDERAIVDPTGGKVVVGVDASGSGLGGSPRNGAIEA